MMSCIHLPPTPRTVRELGPVCSAFAGLTRDEVARRTLLYGPNEFETHDKEPLWKKYLDQVGPPAVRRVLTSAV